MTDNTLHRNMEGVYTIQFFDKYGRPLKDMEGTAPNYLKALKLGNDNISEDAISFIIRRTLYNSLDHKGVKQ